MSNFIFSILKCKKTCLYIILSIKYKFETDKKKYYTQHTSRSEVCELIHLTSTNLSGYERDKTLDKN